MNHYIKQKKAQIKMVESVFVVIFFFMLLMIGVVFMSKFQKTESVKITSEKDMKRAVQLAQSFSSLPELSCSINNVIEENCIDLVKLKKMVDLNKTDHLYYFDLFKYGSVNVEVLELSTGGEPSWDGPYIIYHQEKTNVDYSTIPLPMTIYDPTEKIYKFGIMSVTFYEN